MKETQKVFSRAVQKFAMFWDEPIKVCAANNKVMKKKD